MAKEYLLEVGSHCDEMTDMVSEDKENRTLLVLASDKTLLFPKPEDFAVYQKRLDAVGSHYLLHYYGEGNDIVGSVAMAMCQDESFASVICEAFNRYCNYKQYELTTQINKN